MRSPGVIYRQYRQLRRKLIYDKTVDALLKEHRNCVYGQVLKAVRNDGETRFISICSFRNEKNHENELELCTCPRDCNAFAYRIPKDSVKKAVKRDFEAILADQKKLRETYPELAVYQWVLDKSLTDAMASPRYWAKPLIWLIQLLEELVKIAGVHQKSLSQDK